MAEVQSEVKLLEAEYNSLKEFEKEWNGFREFAEKCEPIDLDLYESMTLDGKALEFEIQDDNDRIWSEIDAFDIYSDGVVDLDLYLDTFSRLYKAKFSII
jgi:hypothetical protein